MKSRRLRGYTQGPDGLFRKRITFATLDAIKPGTASVRVLVRDASGRLIRGETTGSRIRLAAQNNLTPSATPVN